MAGKSEAVAQKKDNEDLHHWLRVAYVVILVLFIVYYLVFYHYCQSGTFDFFLPLALLILLVIALILRSVPLALLVIAIFGVLFYLAPLCPAPPQTCEFLAGIACISSKLSASGGNLTLAIGQGTGHTINVTGVTCSDNMTTNYMPASVAYSGGGSVLMNSGSSATVAQPGGSIHVECTSGGSPIVNAAVGSYYTGKIYINYTETDTGVMHITVGHYKAKYEA